MKLASDPGLKQTAQEFASLFNVEQLRAKKIFVTGSTGFLGRSLLSTLAELDNKWNLHLNLFTQIRDSLQEGLILSIAPKAKIIVWDLIGPPPIVEKMDYIFHLASPTNPNEFMQNPSDVIITNVLSMKNILELRSSKDPTTVFFASTREVYGKNISRKSRLSENELGPIDHTSTRSAYALGKIAAESMLSNSSELFGVIPKIIRFGHVYGTGMTLSDGRIFNDLMGSALSKEKLVIRSDGTQLINPTHIRDAVSGILIVTFKSSEIIFNCSSSEDPISIKALAEMILKQSPIPLDLEVMNEPTDPRKYLIHNVGFLDSGKLRLLGWESKIKLEQGIHLTLTNHN